MGQEFMTLVIHSEERAKILEGLLESHGIEVKVSPLVGSDFSGLNAVRIDVPVSKIALAIRLMESGESLPATGLEMKMTGMSGTLLIPVDFSESTLRVIRLAFPLAVSLGIRPVLLHAYYAPQLPSPVAPFGDIDGEAESMEVAVQASDFRKLAQKKMDRLKAQLKSLQADGEIPSQPFSTVILEGVAEEVILDYCRQNLPMLVVMATRRIDKKGADLVGSVAAEVIDSCRVPILTVPEDFDGSSLGIAKRMLLACSLDRHDVMALKNVMQTFDYPECTVYLVPVDEKPSSSSSVKKLNALRAYFAEEFPMASFESRILPDKNFKEALDDFIHSKAIDLMIVPNKKTNVFRRIFRPSLAHKCLFERDLPMIALPV